MTKEIVTTQDAVPELPRPHIYMMVGIPCSGKSTWADQFAVVLEGCVPLSTDKIIEGAAAATGKTYLDVFPDLIHPAQKALDATIQILSFQKASFVIDMTNVTKQSRKAKLRLIKNKPDYDIIAVYMKTPLAIAHDRLSTRNADHNQKDLSPGVIDSMYERLVEPTESEGFTKVLTIEERLH